VIGVAEIKSFFKGIVLEDEPISRHAWYEIGGPSDFYCIPDTTDDLLSLAKYCIEKQVNYFILGKGSNLLVSDNGIRGIVIDLSKCCSFTTFSGETVDAGAGVYVPKLVLECERQALGGIEMFAGIPGTIGGSVKMNAGCHGKEFFDVIESVTFFDGVQVKAVTKEKIEYTYRHVKIFDDGKRIILSAKLKLMKDDPDLLAARRKEYMKKRQQTQPINLPSSGSVFKNPTGDHAARLIDACGLKGFKVGHASVSTKHANFFVNEGGARAKDVMEIIKHVRKKVKEESGVELELEVKLVGFSDSEIRAL